MSTLPTASQLPLFDEKPCSKCGITKPLSEYYVKIKATGRLLAYCKECHKAATTVNGRANPGRSARYMRERRARDPVAARIKDAEKYARNTEKIKERQRERSQRPEVQVQQATYRLAKRDERIAYNKRYREEHTTERKAYNEAYYEANRDEIAGRIKRSRLKKIEHYNAVASKWKSEHKDAVNASTHKRRASLKGSWTQEDWQRLKATYDWCCLGCGQQEVTDGITLCFDHIIPVSMGGWNLISNGQPLCRSCNSLKHRKVLDLRDRQYPFKEGAQI